MVEFCSRCKCSLPTADIIISGGEVHVSSEYICPECKKPAGDPNRLRSQPDDIKDFTVKDGKIVES